MLGKALPAMPNERNQRRRNRAFHHGYLRCLRFADCRLLDAILPYAPELQAMCKQEIQDAAGHLESRLLGWALSKE